MKESYDGEKFGRIHSRVHDARDYPSFSLLPIASATLTHTPRLAFFHLFPTLSSPMSFSVSRSQRTPPSLTPTTLSAPFHASSRSFSFPPSPALSVRFHPRPSTFRVYRTIARATITVTGRATSWLAVDVGGGRTADRRRRGRRRQRRRRRGRAQQTANKTRRATEKNSSPVDGVIATFPKLRACFVVVNNCVVCREGIHTHLSLVRHPTSVASTS